jgi:uncharacterized LabA/DUF88 family protein
VNNAPHAALLIDFDNVTMGIRSDLTKELKSLLNSDIIKGKVAVQRAYADWRRYPQYIVPLAENSVDLIFAPAYGSSKKNATDIRLSIDALELVFTRPEIGTFILLSGDSDFSSLVLKLKEYGKYVIGVGIRESASDLLVQNCDEYYSYSALTGLTRAGDEELKQWDPWECAEIAVQRMADNDDVMRSDRLKQVILELDPNFDEKAIGFTKFNRFLQEAANRGLLHLHKLENGQFEVAPIDDAAPVVEEAAPPQPRPRRGRRPERETQRAEEPTAEPRAAAPSVVAPSVAVSSVAAAPVSAPPAPAAPAAPSLSQSYQLLRAATQDVTHGRGSARDSDVKRRMLELSPQWSESPLGFSKFSRFLRQAHDAEVINLRKLETGNYEITLPEAQMTVTQEVAEPRARERGRRGRGRREPGSERDRVPLRQSERAEDSAQPAARPAPPVREMAQPPAAAISETPSQSSAVPSRLRRGGSRGRPMSAAPPPLLPGQTLAARETAPQARGEEKPATEKPKTQKPKAERPKAQRPKPQAPALPRDADSIIARLLGYKGVGRKTAEAAVEAFGAANLYDVLDNEPERVHAALGARRAQPLLAGWSSDLGKPSPNGATRAASAAGTSSARSAPRKRSRGTRGGKGRRKSAPRE